MKKSILIIIFLSTINVANAQLVTADQLIATKNRLFGIKNWKNIANSISTNKVLNERKEICYTKVVEAPGRTKEELFNSMKQWMTLKFSGSDCSIQIMDKETATIIAKGSVRNVAESNVLWGDGYQVSLKPIIKIETKDGRARISITIPTYDIHRHIYSTNSDKDELWNVSTCYPFVPIELDSHSLTSSKALVMSHVCATTYIDIIESAILHYKPIITQEENW